MKLLAGLSVFAITVLLGAMPAPQRKHLYCTTDGANGNVQCFCLSQHPDLCDDENSPLPDCCKATEKGTKVEGCFCCAHKKTVAANGVYAHVQE